MVDVLLGSRFCSFILLDGRCPSGDVVYPLKAKLIIFLMVILSMEVFGFLRDIVLFYKKRQGKYIPRNKRSKQLVDRAFI